MAGLIDIAALSETVRFGGAEIPVRGLSARGLANLLAGFPEIRRLMAGAGEISAETIFELGPSVAEAILAEGLRASPEEVAELPLQLQLETLEAMVRLTMPEGVGPFVDRLAKLMEGAGVPSPTA